MKKLLFILLLLPSISLGQEVTTNNQLPQQFFNNNQPHNEWTCTDPTHNHGNNIGIMKDQWRPYDILVYLLR